VRVRFPTSLLLFCVAVASACAPRGPALPPGPVPVQLQTQEIERLAALMRMEDARVLDTNLVARLLADVQPELRGRAALAAGRIRDRAATSLLVAALADPAPAVRARAAFALGEMADSADVVAAALSAAALADVPAVAAEAAASLGLLGLESGRAALNQLLQRRDLSARVRDEALLAAWRLPRDAATTAAIQPWVSHADPEARWRAVFALMRIGGTAVVPTLVAALRDDDPRVRANAARGLRAPLVDSAAARTDALAVLLAAAGDPHPHVRINALRVLPAYRENLRTTPALVRLLRDDDANVAIAAAQALPDTRDASAAAALHQVAGDDARTDGLRSAALHAWIRLQPDDAAAFAAGWADSTRWILRFHGARALGAAGWDVAAAPLLRLTRDPNPLVAAEAFGSVRAAADTLLDLRRVYVEGLGADHPLARAAAVRGLGRHGAADLDILLLAWDRARQDTVRDAAMATLEALGRVRRDGTPVDRAFFTRFGASGPPADAAVHRAIIERIGPPPATWTPPPTAPEPRALAFYTEVVRRLVTPALARGELPLVAIATTHGEIVLELAADAAPLTVHNFLALVERGYYDGTRWHRVVPNFVIQDGDPRGDGSGGPGYAIRDEINPLRYLRGTLGMALSGPDTGGSQFFITHAPQPHLDGGFTVFGRVVSGMDVVDRVVQEEPILGFRRVR
jgi:cyclophilin family peptidyl-prolyl cis-trans isomerase/HEAT repeat protein